MTRDAVTTNIENQVATVTMNQPERSNPLNSAMAAGLRETLPHLRDRDVRCVVVEGAGETFSAGGDVSVMQDHLAEDQTLTDSLEAIEHISGAVKMLAEFPLPTVAKIDGPAVGAGASVAIACDIQAATEDSRVGFVFRNVGLTMDSATSYLLVRLVGLNVAKDLLFRGRILDAQEAADVGLLTHVYPSGTFDDDVGQLATEIAEGPTFALRQSKRLLNDATEKSLDRAWADEAVAQCLTTRTDDFREGVRGFLENDKPDFEGL